MSRRELSRARGFDPRRMARMRQRPMTAGAPPPPVQVFGEECDYIETNALTSTTGTTFITHLTLITPVVPAGDYFVGFRINCQQDAKPGGNVQVRLLEGGAFTIINKDANTFGMGVGKPQRELAEFMGSHILVGLAAGVQTFTMQVRLDPTSGTPGVDEVAIYWACIEFFRWN